MAGQGGPAELNLAGRQAVVTGGASGIGAACAARLAAAGADVVVADLGCLSPTRYQPLGPGGLTMPAM